MSSNFQNYEVRTVDAVTAAGLGSTGSGVLANASWSTRWARALVLRSFNPMEAGHLRILEPGGGILEFGRAGQTPSAEIRIHDLAFYRRCFAGQDVGFGEAFQDGLWDTPDLPAVIAWFCANVDRSAEMSGATPKRLGLVPVTLANRLRHWLNRNTLSGSRSNIAAHYDLGNAFYSLWLDATMTYSSALFESPEATLEQAQTAKYERLARELRLGPEHHLLEIGSGWGGMASHAVRTRGCRVTTLTLSVEQARHCRERFQREGIADRAEVLVLDYRLAQGKYDRIVSIEMMEAVGDAYLGAFCRQVQALLKPDGLFAAQFITFPDCRHADLRRGVDWIQKHIFPGSLLLSINRLNAAMQSTGPLQLHGLHDMGLDYVRTLRAWRSRFNERKAEVLENGFDERFVRTWNYYLSYCESAFLWRNISVVQALWTAPNNPSLMPDSAQTR